MIPLARRPATKVVVFQCPAGALSTRRSPLGPQPERRVMAGVALVSSMKTKRAASMAPAHPRRRRGGRPTSGRSCSLALRLFFGRQAEPVKHVGDGGERL